MCIRDSITSDKIKALCEELRAKFPKDLNITITGDMSIKTRSGLKELINTIVIGFLLVTLILMFFMGVTNAVFVAMSVPLSMFVAFMIMPTYGFTLNAVSYTHLDVYKRQVLADQQLFINAKMPGTVNQILIKTGDRVAAGQTVALLDDAVIKQGLAELDNQLVFATDLYEKQKSLWDQKLGTEVQLSLIHI